MHYSLYSHISTYTKFSIKYKRLYIYIYLIIFTLLIYRYILVYLFFYISVIYQPGTTATLAPRHRHHFRFAAWSFCRTSGLQWELPDAENQAIDPSLVVPAVHRSQMPGKKKCRQAIRRSFGGQELCVKECERACFWYGAVAEDTVQDCAGWLGMSTGSKTGRVGKRSVLN